MNDTDVLIIGAGPTGLILACQLLRYGVSFRIIDKKNDRAHESRAFAIQAKSMEIFQSLGFVDEFIKIAKPQMEFAFFVDGKKQAEVNLSRFKHQDTPFPAIYFLPQSETERIIIEFLIRQGIRIERNKELVTFSQFADRVQAKLKNHLMDTIEKINCAYIVGCDGAHSTVRHQLNLSFQGSTYPQTFSLVDAVVEWPYARDRFYFFLAKSGLFVHIPLSEKISRIMLAQRSTVILKGKMPELSLHEIEQTASLLAQVPVKLTNPIWLSQFRLHHRGVSQYSQHRAFLAGDAAHIHSPAGGQGMNTGIQDASNLAWKLGLILQKNATVKLLDTYETERHPVGKTLLKTTDRLFTLLTKQSFLMSRLKHWLLPFIIRFLFSKKNSERYLFWFVSQLHIRYFASNYVYEITQGADCAFKMGPRAGYRAPNAPANLSTVFDLLRSKPFNVFVFQSRKPMSDSLERFNTIAARYKDWIGVYSFIASPMNRVLFKRYGITSSAIYVIRPDGYIGFRLYGNNYSLLEEYFKRFF